MVTSAPFLFEYHQCTLRIIYQRHFQRSPHICHALYFVVSRENTTLMMRPLPDVQAPTTTTFFPAWSVASLCLLECNICPLKSSYVGIWHQPKDPTFMDRTNLSWDIRNSAHTTAKAQGKYDMIDLKDTLLSISALDCHSPFLSLRTRNDGHDCSAGPNIELHTVCIWFQPICEFQCRRIDRPRGREPVWFFVRQSLHWQTELQDPRNVWHVIIPYTEGDHWARSTQYSEKVMDSQTGSWRHNAA